MVRAKHTANILRSLQIQATTSSSSSSDAESDGENGSDSNESSGTNEARFEGIPNAQTTDDIEEIDSVPDGNTGTHSDAKNSNVSGEVIEEKLPQASADSDQADSEDEERSEVASSGSRKRDHAECEDELYYAAPLRKYHRSWKDLEKRLKSYQEETHTVLVISETMNVRLRNQKISKMKIHAGKPQSELPLVPEELDPYQRVYICTHGWKERVRSKGQRPRQNMKGVGCPMRFRAQFVERDEGKWRIEIKQAFYGHNHVLSEEVYRVYPSVRQVPVDSPIISDVELMVASGSKASKIYEYIRERTPHYIQLKDVHNLVARIRNSGGRLSDEDFVAELLVSFELESPGNVAAIDEDGSGHTAVVTISSQHMRKLYKRFPEILLVNCTHKTNRCVSFLIMVKQVLARFRSLANDWKLTKVIMVDKDLTEIGVLRSMFPDARILLCQFHVLKWLRGAVRDDSKYDTFPSAILKQMDHCVSNMVYSKSDDEFQLHAAEFKYLACRDGRHTLWTYFDRNWVACKEMWVTQHRMELPHFRNNTNNRLESFFGKLKADLDSSMSMRECLEATIRYQRRKEDEYATRVVMPGTRRDLTYDDEMNQLLGMTSEWVAEVFEPEYKFALDPNVAKFYRIEDEDLYVNLYRDGRKHRVDKYNWMCTCEFSSTMKLPCRHGMIYRKHVAHMLTIPYSSIPASFTMFPALGALDEEIAAVDVPLRISAPCADVKRMKRMSDRDKYRAAQSAFSRINTELTDLPDDKFRAALDHLEKWGARLRRGDVRMGTQEAPDEVKPSSQVAKPVAADKPDEEKDAKRHGGICDQEERDENDQEEKEGNEEKVENVHGGDQEEKNENSISKVFSKQSQQKKVKVKPFNPRTRVGRPRKNRALEASQRKQSRQEFNQGCKLRGALRGDDVVEVADFIRSCEPPLSDLASFLNTFEERFSKLKPKQISVVWRVPEPTIAPYRLPEVNATAECWVLTVDGIGEFTHQQLLAMQYVWTLVHASEAGMSCYSWLMNIADDQISHEDTAGLAKRIWDAWPQEILPGFGIGFDITWVHLYSARSGIWYNDNLISAYAKTMESKYGNNTTIFLPAMKIPLPKTPKKGMRLPTTTLSEVSAASEGVIFMPLNINNNHWTCIVVDGPKQTVYCYDSTNKRANHNLLAELADELVKKSLPQGYSITPIHSPIQKDGYNCGLFICLYFWRRFWKEAGSDYTETGLVRRRWDVMHLIVEFSDGSKEKETVAA
ncbi:hypothetical protein PPTG_02860 [Phytophthora nicotianae INRA-310]|uniref:Ubiquitin-like protease family profile domain-containing protein n=2 Tax=Phytophthora nicotianae TaxID=4792 RepID=W2RCT1_PHYN3|nr:hypothetical protein PPTG_02860 [Phytophthora nicotianae INRA-310]ETN23228.1 hypothetical protein PPTG_02860 [Phytophthora nicotianae INRA-310]